MSGAPMPHKWDPNQPAEIQLMLLPDKDSIIVPYGDDIDEIEDAAKAAGLDWEDTDIGLWIGRKRTYLRHVAQRIARLCTDWQTTGALKVQVKFLRAFDAETFLEGMARQRILETETRYHRNRPYRVWRKR